MPLQLLWSKSVQPSLEQNQIISIYRQLSTCGLMNIFETL